MILKRLSDTPAVLYQAIEKYGKQNRSPQFGNKNKFKPIAGLCLENRDKTQYKLNNFGKIGSKIGENSLRYE